MAATSELNVLAALMVTTGNSSRLWCSRQSVTIRVALWTYLWVTQEACILKNSPIYTRGTYPSPGYFLLADGGYPCLQELLALITPYKRPVRGMAEQRFNYHHSRGRSITERAFGMMKTRFRCIFLEALEVHPLFVPKVINHCNISVVNFLIKS